MGNALDQEEWPEPIFIGVGVLVSTAIANSVLSFANNVRIDMGRNDRTASKLNRAPIAWGGGWPLRLLQQEPGREEIEIGGGVFPSEPEQGIGADDAYADALQMREEWLASFDRTSGQRAPPCSATLASLTHLMGIGVPAASNTCRMWLIPVIAAVAEFERDLLMEGTQSGIIRAREEGKQFGRRLR